MASSCPWVVCETNNSSEELYERLHLTASFLQRSKEMNILRKNEGKNPFIIVKISFWLWMDKDIVLLSKLSVSKSNLIQVFAWLKVVLWLWNNGFYFHYDSVYMFQRRFHMVLMAACSIFWYQMNVFTNFVWFLYFSNVYGSIWGNKYKTGNTASPSPTVTSYAGCVVCHK